MEKLLGPKGVKLFEMRKEKSFIKQVDDLAASMRGFQKEPGNLKEYSLWLSGFKADIFNNELEVPGQHTNYCILNVYISDMYHKPMHIWSNVWYVRKLLCFYYVCVAEDVFLLLL